jgi:hypothetical protein
MGCGDASMTEHRSEVVRHQQAQIVAQEFTGPMYNKKYLKGYKMLGLIDDLSESLCTQGQTERFTVKRYRHFLTSILHIGGTGQTSFNTMK